MSQLSIALLAFAIMVSGVSAVTPPYKYGGAGQYTESGIVHPTEINLHTGKFRMFGECFRGMAGYCLADSWGYFGIEYVTASQSGTIHAFTTVAYDGVIKISAIFWFFFGWARAGAWLRQTIRVYDTSDSHLVVSNTYWVYSQTVKSSTPGWENWAERVFNGAQDKFTTAVDFTATAGKSYAIETFV